MHAMCAWGLGVWISHGGQLMLHARHAVLLITSPVACSHGSPRQLGNATPDAPQASPNHKQPLSSLGLAETVYLIFTIRYIRMSVLHLD